MDGTGDVVIAVFVTGVVGKEVGVMELAYKSFVVVIAEKDLGKRNGYWRISNCPRSERLGSCKTRRMTLDAGRTPSGLCSTAGRDVQVFLHE